MKVLIAGGKGFLGSALSRSLMDAGHEVRILTRGRPVQNNEVQWDGRSMGEWARSVTDMDTVVNLTGYGLEHWPWSGRQKQRFLESRVAPGQALTAAIQAAGRKPRTFLQISGINYYGARGQGVADETWPPADDYLAQLAVQWEAATAPVEQQGVRRVVARTAVVLSEHGGLLPLMVLAVRLFVGGRLGSGKQAVPWIHIADEISALRLLLERKDAGGPYNLIAPQLSSNAEFMQAAARALRRPYWFHAPAFALQAVLGEMSTLVLEGRYSQPKRLSDIGFEFRYPTIEAACADLLGRGGT